jgi:hypothetical protein
LSGNVANTAEKEELINLMFTKTHKHKVKFLPFDYSWQIMTEFIPVTEALVKLSSVMTILSIHHFQDKHAVAIVDHVRFLYNTLKTGLIVLGCSNPPYTMEHVNMHKDTILEIARQVNDSFLQDGTC